MELSGGQFEPAPAERSSTEAERRAEAMLGARDGWLLELGVPEGTLTDAWFAAANHTITIATTDLRYVANEDEATIEAVQQARKHFFHENLTLSESSLLSSSLQLHVARHYRHGRYPSPFTFIANCKQFYALHVDISTVPGDVLFEARPYHLPHLVKVLDDIGLSVERALKYAPAVLNGSSHYVASQVAYIRRTANALGLADKADDFMRQMPRVLVAGRQRLRVLARIAAEHGDFPSAQKLKNPFVYGYTQPLSTHLIAIARHETYEPRHAKTLTAQLKGNERREKLFEVLESEGAAMKIGAKIIQDYLQLEPLDAQEERTHPGVAQWMIDRICSYAGITWDELEDIAPLLPHDTRRLAALHARAQAQFNAKGDFLEVRQIRQLVRDAYKRQPAA